MTEQNNATPHPPSRFAAVGLLPGLAGAMVLPSCDAAAQADLLAGRFDALPASWRFLGQLARNEHPGPGIGAFNSAVLDAEPDALLRELGEDLTDDLAGNLVALASAVAYRLGAGVELPAPATVADPFVRAYISATQAHAAGARGNLVDAATELCDGAAGIAGLSPGASARLVGEAAALYEESEPPARVVLELEHHAVALDGLGFEDLRGELLMRRAMLLSASGRPAALQEAVRCYQRATQAYPRRTRPIEYAACHLNVAVAYLSMPMNRHADKLRSAIAVQSLRESLEIFTPDEHPAYWEAATLNLANALQHLPSSHVAENLVEAVGLYEQLLERRSEDGAARARAEANLGNALAHLGRFDEARPHLESARSGFEAAGDTDAAAGVAGVIGEMEAVLAGAGPAGS